MKSAPIFKAGRRGARLACRRRKGLGYDSAAVVLRPTICAQLRVLQGYRGLGVSILAGPTPLNKQEMSD